MKKTSLKHLHFDGTSFINTRCKPTYAAEVNAHIMLGDYDGLLGWIKKRIDMIRYPKIPASEENITTLTGKLMSNHPDKRLITRWQGSKEGIVDKARKRTHREHS